MRKEFDNQEKLFEDEQRKRWVREKLRRQHDGFLQELQSMLPVDMQEPKPPFETTMRLQELENMFNPYFPEEDRRNAADVLRPHVSTVPFHELEEDEKRIVRYGIRYWLRTAANPFRDPRRSRREIIKEATSVFAMTKALFPPTESNLYNEDSLTGIEDESVWNDTLKDIWDDVRTEWEEKRANRFNRPEETEEAERVLLFIHDARSYFTQEA